MYPYLTIKILRLPALYCPLKKDLLNNTALTAYKSQHKLDDDWVKVIKLY